MAKSNFIVRGGGDFSGLYKEFNKAQKKMTSFQTGLNKAMSGLKIALGTVAVGKLIKDSTKAAMGVESSTDNIARNMGESSKAFNEWVNTQSKHLAMAKDEAYQYGSTFSNLLGSFITDAKETSDQTQELMKAAAIISSKTGRTYDDVANRIRSGMLGSTEAIEDLGVYTQVSMLESTEAFKKFAGNKFWAQLDFQTQQQIRLNAILEQSFKRYGDTLAGTTQTKQQMFLATLKNIRLNLGQAFLPVYNVVLPALTSLASKIESITASLAAFTQALFGKSATARQTQQQADAVGELGDATEEAGKQAKNSVAGFDEINQLSINDGNAATAGTTPGGGVVTETTTTDDSTGGAIDSMATKAAEVAEKVKNAFNTVKNAIVENKDIIIPAVGAVIGVFSALALYAGFNNLIDTFKKVQTAVKILWGVIAANPILIVIAVIGALVGAFVTAYKTNDEFRTKVDKLWLSIKTSLAPVIEQLGNVLKWVWNNVMVPLGQFISGVFQGLWQGLGKIIKWVWNNILVPLGNFLIWLWNSVLVPLGRILIDVLGIAFQTVADIASSFWHNVLVPLGLALAEMFGPAVEAVSSVLQFLWNSVFVPFGAFINGLFRPIIEALIKVFQFLWNSVLKPIAEFVAGRFSDVFDTVFRFVGDIVGGLKDIFIGLMDFITGVFTGDWGRAWEGVKKIFKGVFDSLWGIVKFPLNLIIGGINSVIGALNSLSIKIPDWVPKFGGQTWGVNIPTIPKLAKGGITGVNDPFLAMVGDNRTQREVIAPLGDLTDIIANAVGNAVLAAMQVTGQNTSDDREVVLEMDGTKLIRTILPRLDRELVRMGYKTIYQTT